MSTSAEADPMAILAEFARRAMSGADDVPAFEGAAQTAMGVGVRAASRLIIIPLSEVHALVELRHCTRIPGTQPWLRGLAHAGGRLVSVVDLGAFLSQSGPSDKLGSWLVCLLGDAAPVGLLVDEVIGLKRFPDDAVMQGSPDDDDALSSFSAGIWRDEDQAWCVLDVQTLLASSRFLQVAG